MPTLKLLYCYIAKLLNRKKQYNNRTIQQFNKGFTLIELLVVISIIGILVSAAAVSWTNAQKKGRDAKRKADLKSIQQALELYFQQKQGYPAQSSKSTDPGWSDQAYLGLASYLVVGGFIKELPKDPINIYNGTTPTSNTYMYQYLGLTTSYRLFTRLENLNDPDVQYFLNQWRNYLVTNP